MFPMHLGLIDGPFVPDNQISTQESPVHSPKFQMAPRLKILMFSGSTKVTPSRFFSRAPMERYLLTGNFYISLDISL